MLFLKKAFYPIFSLLFLFSFFLIEGEYKFYLFTLWSVFLLISSIFFKVNKKVHSSKSMVFALILSVLFIVGTIFSKQIPLSIEKLLFYLVSLAIFIFFQSLSKENFKSNIFFDYLSILALVTNAIVLFFTFYEDQQNLFPGMNILVRSYGHNHYAAFLLLLLPIFWWQFLFAFRKENKIEKENYFLIIVLLISSYLLIIFSLARLVLFIALIQLCIIFFTHKKLFFSFDKDHLAKTMAKVFIFVFATISTFFLFLSTPLNEKVGKLCPLVFSRKEICKPLLENDRLVYWQKSWLIFAENPYFGAGLKSFNSISRRFPIKSYQITSYAHNIFLHNLAEGGLLIGLSFFIFIIYIFYQSFLMMKKTNDPLYQFLWLAAISSLLNAMLDFDWNFFVIFVFTLIAIAIILQNDKTSKIKSFNCGCYYVFLVIITVITTSEYLTARLLYKNNRPDLMVKYVPYIDQQMRLLWNEKKLQSKDFEILYPLYENDADFVRKYISNEQSDYEKQISLQIKLADIDPLAFINLVDFSNFNFQLAAPLADKLVEVIVKHHFLNNLTFLSYWDQKNFAQQFLNFANQAYLANDLELAVDYYQKVFVLNEFVTENREVAFLEETDRDKSVTFLKLFKDVNPHKMGTHFNQYMSLYEKDLLYLFQSNSLDDFFILADEIFNKEYNFSWFLFNDLTQLSASKEDQQNLLAIYDRYKGMTTWQDFMPIIEQAQKELAL